MNSYDALSGSGHEMHSTPDRWDPPLPAGPGGGRSLSWWPPVRGWVFVAAMTAMVLPALAQVTGAPPASLLAHWRFDETSGTTVQDATGRYPGRLSATGATLGAEGVTGAAVRLQADPGGTVLFGNVLPMLNQAYSLSVWFRMPAGEPIPTEAVLIAKHVPWIENGYFIILNSSGHLLSGYSGAGWVQADPTDLNDGRWHHVVMTVSVTGDLTLYYDGSPLATAKSGPVVDSAAELKIGGVDPGPPPRRFHGWIDEVQVYDMAIRPEEVHFLSANPGATLEQMNPVTFAPAGGEVASPVAVSIFTRVVGAQIRYTLDGSEPVASSALYASPFPVTVTGPTAVRARAFLNGFPVSEVFSATYVPDPGIQFQPVSVLFTNQVAVSLSSRLPGVELRYTLDGNDPLMASPRYLEPIRLTQATTLKARAFLNGFPVTEVLTRRYQRVYVFEGDGIPADWRTRHFGADYRTDPRAAIDADPDLDGSTNRQEFVAGTDPLDPRSGLSIGVRAVPEIRFPTVPGTKYRLLRRASLDDPKPVVVTEITAVASETTYVDVAAGVLANPAFYLVEPLP